MIYYINILIIVHNYYKSDTQSLSLGFMVVYLFLHCFG